MLKALITAATLALSTAALGGEIDFSRHIVDLDGNDIPASAAKGDKPLDLATVAGMALLTEPPADPRDARAQPTPADKLARFSLAIKVHDGKTVSLSAEEIALVKSAISASYGPLVVGRANEILDPTPASKH